jgi:iron complex transport system substrate-binding protein
MKYEMLSRRISRRTAVASTLAFAAFPAVMQSVGAQDATAAASPASGKWTFTDDKGVTVTLPEAPENLVIDVNAAAPLWDFGIRPTALFGWNAASDGNFGDAGGNIDPEGIVIVGDTSEPIKLEDTVAVDPDVIITLTWTPDNPEDYWSIQAELLPQVQAIAPIIAMSATGMADANTERFAELAAALGADLESDELKAAWATYDEASRAFDQALADKNDLKVAFFYIDDTSVYVASPTDWADLNMYLERGMDIVQPDAEAGSFWEELSPEQALKYPSDILMSSTRMGAFTPDELKAHPTFGQHPAIKAGQVYGWNQDFIQSYQGMAEAMDTLRAHLEQSEKILEG